MKIVRVVLVLLVLVSIFSSEKVFAESDGEFLKLKEVEFYTGVADARPRKGSPEEYSLNLLGCKLGFNLLRNSQSKWLFELITGPFINFTTEPKGEMEIGADLLLKVGYKGWGRIMPYFKGGFGVIYASHKFENQSTQFNFLVQEGLGIAFFNKAKNSSVNLEYRFRHFSNAGLENPNYGVDVEEFLIGFSHYF